jgi:hypothetical protein
MGTPQAQRDGARFIGTIEQMDRSWKASYRLRQPTDVFAQPGKMEVFATELQAVKWLHSEAAARGFTAIEIERKVPSGAL